jgi:sec-independent protein translocase protein TatC
MNQMKMQSFFSIHLSELRWKFFYGVQAYFLCIFFSYIYFDQFIFLFAFPLYSTYENYSKDFITTEITEAFYTVMSVSFYVSFVFCLPLFFYLVLTFFRSSYYRKESTWTCFVSCFSLVLFYFSHILAFFCLLPMFCSFLLYFDTQQASEQGKLMISLIQLEPRLLPYIQFSLKIFWGSHFICQTPVVAYFIFLLYPQSTFFIVENRRYFHFFLLLCAAILSPPDVSIQSFCFFLFMTAFEIVLLFYIILYNYSKVEEAGEK